MPDCVSAAAKTCLWVCLGVWQRENNCEVDGGGGEELITIFASHFTLSRHGVEESAKAQEEQQGEKEKNK